MIARVTPDVAQALKAKGLSLGSPVFLRVIKSPSPKNGHIENGVLEVYVKSHEGQYVLFKSYDICAASGTQGPKMKTGDGQSPEGFYFVSASRFNPWSSYHLSLNLGYPNSFDRAHNRTGNYLMVHGNCVSIGCYAMTDAGIEEIYTLAYKAVANGQKIVRVHAFPFPMTQTNMEAAKGSPHYSFWKNLKQGWDWFETKHIPPNVNVSHGEYIFSPLPISLQTLR